MSTPISWDVAQPICLPCPPLSMPVFSTQIVANMGKDGYAEAPIVVGQKGQLPPKIWNISIHIKE